MRLQLAKPLGLLAQDALLLRVVLVPVVVQRTLQALVLRVECLVLLLQGIDGGLQFILLGLRLLVLIGQLGL